MANGLEDILAMGYAGGDNSLQAMAPPPRKFVIAGQEYYTTPSATGGSLAGPGFSFPQVTPQQFYTWATKPISEDIVTKPVSEEEKQALYQKGYEWVEPHLLSTMGILKGLKVPVGNGRTS